MNVGPRYRLTGRGRVGDRVVVTHSTAQMNTAMTTTMITAIIRPVYVGNPGSPLTLERYRSCANA